MKTLYLDCFAGISGDMFLGALFDLGVPIQTLSGSLTSMNLPNYRLTSEKIVKNSICGTKARVLLLQKEHHHRHLSNIIEIINDSSLPMGVKKTSIRVFENLASAEAKIHGVPVDKIRFHEVGAVDSIIDIVGVVTSLDILGVEQVLCSPLPLGTGFVECAHGTLPLPTPATMELLKGIPVKTIDIVGETVTPTGAALVKTLVSAFGPIPAIQIQATGYGAGDADRVIPNLLRAVLGETSDSLSELDHDALNVVEANIDDMNPEFYEYILPQMFSAGAVDVFLTPVIMKKGRPAQIITCLVPEDKLNFVVNTLFSETTTLGIRTYPCQRYKLTRETISVDTAFGPVSVKIGRHPMTGQVLNIAPEWKDCRTVAEQNKIPVKTVYDLAKNNAYNYLNP